MADLFVLALLGHLVGDHLLQTKNMTLHKSASGFSGILICTLHVTVYTVTDNTMHLICLWLVIKFLMH